MMKDRTDHLITTYHINGVYIDNYQ